MPTFEYQAKRPDGSMERGVVVSASLDGAASDLAAKGMVVTQLGLAMQNDPLAGFTAVGVPGPRSGSAAETPRSAPASSNPYDPVNEVARSGDSLAQRSYMATSVAGPLVGTVPLANIGFFFRQASTMLNAGVPIVQALNTLANQARNPKLEGVLHEMARQIEAGNPISAVMQRYPEVYTPVMLSMVRAGEEGGFLDQALSTVADYIDQEIALRNLYRKATFWPKLELAASIVIIIAANMIIDAIKPDATHLHSPLTTLATWFVIAPIALGIFLFLRIGLANPRIRHNWDLFISYVPYLGNTLRQIAMARFGRAFGALYRSGVPMQRALQLSADACGNEYLRSQMYPAYRRLEEGTSITETLDSTHAFSPIVLDMMRTGETTGEIDQMLTRVSEFYVEEAQVRQAQFGLVVGIFLSLCTAIYIGYVVINFYISMASGLNQATE